MINLINSFESFISAWVYAHKYMNWILLFHLSFKSSLDMLCFCLLIDCIFTRCISHWKFEVFFRYKNAKIVLNCVSANIMRTLFSAVIHVYLWVEWIYTYLQFSWNRIHVAKIVNMPEFLWCHILPTENDKIKYSPLDWDIPQFPSFQPVLRFLVTSRLVFLQVSKPKIFPSSDYSVFT